MVGVGNSDNESIKSSATQYTHNPLPIGKIHFSGDSNEYIHFGDKKYFTHEFMNAFGGTLTNSPAPLTEPKYGNAAALGLSAFAMTTFVLSLINAGAMGIKTNNIVIGLAVFYGGAAQFCTGIWELFLGNTFGATALTLYGGFWLSFGAISLDAFGIASAYTDETELASAVGFFLTGWAIFTFMLTLVTLKSTVAFFSLFFTLTITFMLLAAGEFTGKTGVTRAGGVFGVITAFIAWYNAWAGTATRQNSYITSHVIPLPVFGKKTMS